MEVSERVRTAIRHELAATPAETIVKRLLLSAPLHTGSIAYLAACIEIVDVSPRAPAENPALFPTGESARAGGL